ncbi:type I-E CRISPR-associated protein Cse2/CasB [Lautropia mirabilis]
MSEKQRQWVRDWWRSLDPRDQDKDALPGELRGQGRADRARLRRCQNAEELLSNSATLLFARRLISLGGSSKAFSDESQAYEQLAWVAGALAHVKEDPGDERTLAFRLGKALGGERPAMSELRFRSLQAAAATDDFFLQIRRAIQLADRKTDVARLADDLFVWQLEQGKSASRASSGVKFHWAYDYYLSVG